MRTLANISFSLVLVVTLLWGGCLSCSQYFMFPNSSAGCCHPAGHCGKSRQTPATKDCHIQPFAVTKTFSGVSAVASLPAITAPVVVAAMAETRMSGALRLTFFLPQVSPADLCSLHSVFRI